MAQWAKVPTPKASRPEFDPQNPYKVERREMTFMCVQWHKNIHTGIHVYMHTQHMVNLAENLLLKQTDSSSLATNLAAQLGVGGCEALLHVGLFSSK